MIKVYLDSCCFNRPFDDLKQERIRLEAEAVKSVINLSAKGKLVIVSSEFVKHEIKQIKNDKKREKVLELYCADEYHVLTNKIGRLAKYYQNFNLKTFDALHLATAEEGGVDYVLTTDIDFINYSKRCKHSVKVINPCDFIKEEFDNAAKP